MGNAALRNALFFPALAAAAHTAIVRALRERLLARGRNQMASIGAAMRKLWHLVFGGMKIGKLFDPAYGQQATA
jgi:ribose 1,5-bisphosphokinase PhnN